MCVNAVLRDRRSKWFVVAVAASMSPQPHVGVACGRQFRHRLYRLSISLSSRGVSEHWIPHCLHCGTDCAIERFATVKVRIGQLASSALANGGCNATSSLHGSSGIAAANGKATAKMAASLSTVSAPAAMSVRGGPRGARAASAGASVVGRARLSAIMTENDEKGAPMKLSALAPISKSTMPMASSIVASSLESIPRRTVLPSSVAFEWTRTPEPSCSSITRVAASSWSPSTSTCVRLGWPVACCSAASSACSPIKRSMALTRSSREWRGEGGGGAAAAVEQPILRPSGCPCCFQCFISRTNFLGLSCKNLRSA
mmetsp:Transcript_27835/g.93518  ORF Transcript_27835/g.93518 Transcript_27835/m.93518 type:complete len:314 (-) Transcript_27835:1174-2115(-)